MRHKVVKFASAAALSLFLVGCQAFDKSLDVDLIATGYASADRLFLSLTDWSLQKGANGGTVLYTSLARIDHLDRSSSFGQMMAEHIASRLSRQPTITVSEVRLQKAFSITASGEFMLSRDITKIDRKQSAAYVMVGTYAEGADTVLVNVKLIDIASGRIVAADDFSVPLGPNVASLLAMTVGGEEKPAQAHALEDRMGGDTKAVVSRAVEYCRAKGMVPLMSDVERTKYGSTSSFTCVPR